METERERAARYAAKPRIQKLGVKPGMTVVLVGVTDATLADEVRAADARIVRTSKAADVVFLQADAPRALARVATAARMIEPTGAVWVLTPRKTPGLMDVDVIRAAKAAGLVDVKVVRFSDTHTSLKLMVPRAKR